MKKLKGVFTLISVVFVLLLFVVTVSAEDTSIATNPSINTSDFIDLRFNIDSLSYFSKGINKNLETAPFIDKTTSSTMVPFRTIFQELGYKIQWDGKTKTILASSERGTIKLQIDKNTALVDKKQVKMTVPPKVVAGRTVVPLRFVSESAGATVEWDGKTKTIYITKIGKFDTGKVLVYEKKDLGAGRFENISYLYDGTQIKTIPMNNREIKNHYSYKGKVLLTMFDKEKDTNSVVIFENDNFKTLIEDFDILDTFEYNGNLLMHGYDRNQKHNKLCRFDGANFFVVADNFYVGRYVIFKEKLVINKYDNLRNYSILAFDKYSWNPSVLEEGFVIKDSTTDGNNLYMTGVRQVGYKNPLAMYNGNSIDKSSFTIIHDDIDVTRAKDVVLYKGKVYVISRNKLYYVENKELKSFGLLVNGYAVSATFTHLVPYNDNLYFAISEIKYGTDALSTAKPVYPCILEYNGNSIEGKVIIDQYLATDLKVENDVLFTIGKNRDKYGSYSEPVAHLLDKSFNNKLSSVMDVSELKNIIKVDNKMFIAVKDLDRITDKPRETILLYENGIVKNLVLGNEMRKWSNIQNTLIFAGYEADINRLKVYTYGTKFTEQLGNFIVNSWFPMEDRVFSDGLNSDDNKVSVYGFMKDGKYKVIDQVLLKKMVKAKGSYYIMYCNIQDNSLLYGKNVLYIYNDADHKFVEMKVDIQLADIIFVE
ncbi:MAG: copper amine oxidase N-terminal domain-containing protein [Clostridia bacterium]|nr:copper amine oxidase N-terminal domain-containing protein [Clostridia bacterium]